MKKEYIKPNSRIFKIKGKEFILQDKNFGDKSREGSLLHSAGKDRGDYDDEDYEDVW